MGSYNQAVREAVQLASNLGFLPADAVAAANNLGNPSNTNELAGLNSGDA